MTAVANIFDVNGDGYIDYYEFVSALHPSRDPYRRTVDIDQINEEVFVYFRFTIYHICISFNQSKQNVHFEQILNAFLAMYLIDI